MREQSNPSLFPRSVKQKTTFPGDEYSGDEFPEPGERRVRVPSTMMMSGTQLAALETRHVTHKHPVAFEEV